MNYKRMKLWLGSLLNYVYNNIINHIPWHRLRILFLRIFNKRIHPSAKILLHTRILSFWDIEIAENVVINQYCLLDCRRHPIRIGHNSDIGPHTHIWTLGHDPDEEHHALYGGPVEIGHHVWIASRATILPGIVLGDGCVVGAGSVVHKSVASKKIVAGNPAKEIRDRNNTLSYQLKYRPIFE